MFGSMFHRGYIRHWLGGWMFVGHGGDNRNASKAVSPLLNKMLRRAGI